MDRRGILKLAVAFPALRRIGALSGSVESDAANVHDFHFLAVRTLRLTNTAQAYFKKEHGYYADLHTLISANSTRKLLYEEPGASKTEGALIGKSLFSNLKFGEEQILPGWAMQMSASSDGSGYVILMEPRVDDTGVRAFSTDQEGLIYEGVALDSDRASSPVTSAQQVLDNAAAIRKKNQTIARVSAALKKLAIGPAVPQLCLICSYCHEFSCCCGGLLGAECCSCSNSCDYLCGCCLDCGCSGCVWCC